jgi:hypothetical protein
MMWKVLIAALMVYNFVTAYLWISSFKAQKDDNFKSLKSPIEYFITGIWSILASLVSLIGVWAADFPTFMFILLVSLYGPYLILRNRMRSK